MELTICRSTDNRLSALHARDEVERTVAQSLGPHRMDAHGREPFHSELYDVPLHDGALIELCYGRETLIDFGENDHQFLFRLTLAGTCELRAGHVSARANAGELTVSSPARASRILTSPDCRNLVLRLDRTALERKLQDMLQASLTQPLHFELATRTQAAGAGIVTQTFSYLCRIGADSAMRATPGSDLTQWLMSVLLTQLPHSYSDRLARGTPPPLPAHVRRARDYIEAHLGASLSLATLAQVTGVSARTLQNGFREFLNTTPAAYVRDRRLAAVHAALRADPIRSVADVLIEHGINSFGHFAKAYMQRYGHPPAATRKHVR